MTDKTLLKWKSLMISDAFVEKLVEFSEIRAFIKNTTLERKQAIVIFGANWCPDCRILAGLTQSAQMLESIRENFKFMLIDVLNYEINMDVLKQLDPTANSGIPRLFIFDNNQNLINLDRNDYFRTVRSMHENALIDYLDSFRMAT
ncbi:MAG: thioredoxin family protein [Gammaproteobacteria bacterium]